MSGIISRFDGFGRISKRVVLSYLIDWIILVGIGVITYGINQVDPVYHPFALVDLSISYPFKEELITTTDLTLGAIIGPALLIALICLLAVPGPYASRRVPWTMQLRRKFWELNTGWLGLALSVLAALLITTGLKNIVGKPRPNALARCQPDTSPESIAQHTVGKYAADWSAIWVLVDVGICTQKDRAALNDGFRSWPSGHSSTAWAGLMYLSLFLCSKFAVVFPHLPSEVESRMRRLPGSHQRYTQLGMREANSMDTRRPMLDDPHNHEDVFTPFNGRRNEAAAPPLYLLFCLIVPLGVACFVCATRFYDYRHHGFDIISGSFIGIFTSWFSFRLYHMPVARGSGWSWGPRSAGRAFGVGVGSNGYVSAEDLPQREAQDDLELGFLPRRSPMQTDSTYDPGAGTNMRSKSLIGRSETPDPAMNLDVPGKKLPEEGA